MRNPSGNAHHNSSLDGTLWTFDFFQKTRIDNRENQLPVDQFFSAVPCWHLGSVLILSIALKGIDVKCNAFAIMLNNN